MDKMEKLLNYVQGEEDKYYDFSHKAMEKGNETGFLIHQAEATAFQRVRYAIEQLIEYKEVE
jgi:hypothetical protein